MNIKSEVVAAVRERLSGSEGGDVMGLLCGFLVSTALLIAGTTGGYYFASGGKMHPPVLAALIAGVLLAAWLVGWLIGSNTDVGQISQKAYDSSSTVWDRGLSADLMIVSLLLPVLQFFCGSLYSATNAILGRGRTDERGVLVAAAVVEGVLEHPGASATELFDNLSHHGLSPAEYEQTLRLLKSRGILLGGHPMRIADDVASRCR